VSGQLESRHFLKSGDTVQHLTGLLGTVSDSFALYAVVEWDDGRREEVEQLDPTVIVLERGEKE
jgi:hypothetical protein